MKVERWDTSGEHGWDMDIRRFDMGKRYNIYHSGDEVRCTVSNLTGPIPMIDFTGFKWMGKVNIQGHAVDEFDAPTANNMFSRYYQDSMTMDPTRLVTSGPNDETIDFYEFDKGAQDPSLFDVKTLAPNVVCNERPPEDQGLINSVRMAWLDAPNAVQEVAYYSPPSMLKDRVNYTAPTACDSGQASWYDCTGNAACGACNTAQNIAAHKTLACGTALTVTDTKSGKAVDVKVADRGPYVAGRIVDLNRAPATAIGMINAGVIDVRICW
jgi:rare lipoprotein A